MKFKILFLTLGIISYNLCFSQTNYLDQIQKERQEINARFADTSISILVPEDISEFQGLHFYSIDSNYRIKAKFRKLLFKKKFYMVTSTDRLPRYRKYGVMKFFIGESRYKLFLYENLDYKKKHPEYDEVFCPFIDESRNDKSYGGGRYLDFHIPNLSKWTIIDFNKSYNPYCAYNNRYSCPIPPRENHLKVAIPAGIQRWHD